MKLLRYVLSVSFVLLFFASAALAAPRAAVDHPVFDFGTVAHGKSVDHVFILKNSGDSPLTIGQVSTSCGCTVADVSTRSVAPGKSAGIRVTFNSTNFSGNISKDVLVKTNDPAKPVYKLVVKGVVFEEIEVTPKQLNLGEIKAGTKKETSVKIENRGKQPLTITSAKSTMPQVIVKSKNITIKPGASTTINLTVKPRGDDRFLGGYINIATGSRDKSEIIIPVYATVVK